VHLSLGTMHVRETGPANGPVVLLVHGSVIGGYAWRQWQAPLASPVDLRFPKRAVSTR
jgi:pimeloyl-ACP methyl ester carboxylesterase